MRLVLMLVLVASTAAWLPSSLLPEVARAQSRAELGEARELFERGLAAAREERWDDAREAFERSLAIVERPSTLLNLAGAQAQTGRLVAAAEAYRRFLTIATEREARHRAGAQTALHDLEARIARVTILAEGAQPGDRAELNGSAVSLGTRVPLDPGTHDVVVLRGDEEVGRRSFTLEEQDEATIVVTVQARTGPSQALAMPEPAPAEEPVDGGDGGDDTWIWVGVGIGAAVAIGVAVGVGVAVGTSEPTYYGGNLGDGMIRF